MDDFIPATQELRDVHIEYGKIGSVLRGFRIRDKLSQAELADKLDCPQPWISAWESGTRYLDKKMVSAADRRIAVSIIIDELQYYNDGIPDKLNFVPQSGQPLTAQDYDDLKSMIKDNDSQRPSNFLIKEKDYSAQQKQQQKLNSQPEKFKTALNNLSNTCTITQRLGPSATYSTPKIRL